MLYQNKATRRFVDTDGTAISAAGETLTLYAMVPGGGMRVMSPGSFEELHEKLPELEIEVGYGTLSVHPDVLADGSLNVRMTCPDRARLNLAVMTRLRDYLTSMIEAATPAPATEAPPLPTVSEVVAGILEGTEAPPTPAPRFVESVVVFAPVDPDKARVADALAGIPDDEIPF